MFDQYDASTFKFAAIDPLAGAVVIGHHSSRDGLVIDASQSALIDANQDHELSATVKGTTVSVMLDGMLVVSHSFNSVAVDGGSGLFTAQAGAAFSSVTVATDDPAYLEQDFPDNLLASGAVSYTHLTLPTICSV